MGGDEGEAPSVALLAQTLREFLALVAEDLKDEASRFGRELPLVAVPIFGAGHAAENVLRGDDRGGEIIKEMLQELHEFTSSHAIDIALCTIDPAAFGAALQARRQLIGARDPDKFGRLWRLRPPADVASIDGYNKEVDAMAERFLDGQVSVFLGAGVSINAGLPSWCQLIDMIAIDIGLLPADRTALAQLNPLEAASVLAERAGGERALKQLTARIIGSAKRHSLQHALLAGLPFKGCVTTNFDELFELAVRATGAEMAVLPADVGGVTDKWCLKLHGSASVPMSIVLTRADYSTYSRTQAASEGVLQGLLLTQHVLFVGFSMRDENWCRIAETVRGSLASTLSAHADGSNDELLLAQGWPCGESTHARRDGSAPPQRSPGHSGHLSGIAADERGVGAATSSRPLGTVLPLEADGLFDSLWQGLLHVTPIDQLHCPIDARSGAEATETSRISEPPADSVPPPRQRHLLSQHARNLDVFLDHVASAVESRRCRVLLNPKYASLLTPRSLALRKALMDFLRALPPDAKSSGPFQPVMRLLMRMGLRTEAIRELLGDDTLEGPYRARLAKLMELDDDDDDNQDTSSSTSSIGAATHWRYRRLDDDLSPR